MTTFNEDLVESVQRPAVVENRRPVIVENRRNQAGRAAKQTYVRLNSYEVFFFLGFKRCRQFIKRGKNEMELLADIKTTFPETYSEISPFIHDIDKDDAVAGWQDGYQACIQGEQLNVS